MSGPTKDIVDLDIPPPSKLGRVSVLIEERPPDRAAVRMHLRQFEGEDVQETITLARARLEQLLGDAAKVTAIRAVLAPLLQNVLEAGATPDDIAAMFGKPVAMIYEILEAP